MKLIEAYQSVDGSIYTSERKALENDENCIGIAIDELLSGAVAACNGNVTRSDQYRMSLYLINNKTELRASVSKLYSYLNDED